jgi:hypothetical protein
MDKFSMKALIALVAVFIFAGCSKLTTENYAKVQTGMSFAEVTAILGGPDSCDDALGFKSCRWGDDTRNVTVRFFADQVVLHSAEHIR